MGSPGEEFWMDRESRGGVLDGESRGRRPGWMGSLGEEPQMYGEYRRGGWIGSPGEESWMQSQGKEAG